MSWFGPKGVATMAFALFVLGSAAPEAERVFNIAALAVLVSIIAHGLTDHAGSEWIAGREPDAKRRPRVVHCSRPRQGAWGKFNWGASMLNVRSRVGGVAVTTGAAVFLGSSGRRGRAGAGGRPGRGRCDGDGQEPRSGARRRAARRAPAPVPAPAPAPAAPAPAPAPALQLPSAPSAAPKPAAQAPAARHRRQATRLAQVRGAGAASKRSSGGGKAAARRTANAADRSAKRGGHRGGAKAKASGDAGSPPAEDAGQRRADVAIASQEADALPDDASPAKLPFTGLQLALMAIAGLAALVGGWRSAAARCTSAAQHRSPRRGRRTRSVRLQRPDGAVAIRTRAWMPAEVSSRAWRPGISPRST